MAFAKGRSSVVVELDILRDTLENMINSIEEKFQNKLDLFKARIFDLEHNQYLPFEEKDCQIQPFYNEIEEYTCQLYRSRNKLVICIYSICEATLANICANYRIELKHEKKKDERKKDYYLTDYLFSIDKDYKKMFADAYIVSFPLRELRNHLTHSASAKDISKYITDLNKRGFKDIRLFDGQVIIESKDFLISILNCCYNLMIDAENTALESYLNNPKSPKYGILKG
ncbi:MAG: hypothetical protein HDS40_04610 [Bacteroides sp.]|nr:hypothetical protein [Bacteroides sp.]